ncbi:MAG: hypothetical protein E7586_07065 [Ruminococcaceae bacterium]|nr:hypothetical protein [Oscillospiraceae bacterium]
MSKNVIIFGDSYSTFKGIIPEGYEPYYYPGGYSNGVEKNDVETPEDTWWGQLIPEIGGNLLLNNSWSGSTVGYTGYNNVDCSESSSFIYRFKQLRDAGFFKENKIDTVFVFGGTNDCWCGAPMGELKYEGWTKEDLYSVLPAFSYFLKILTDELKDCKIVAIVNSELGEPFTQSAKTAIEHYGITPVMLEDIDKLTGHPTLKGMTSIKEQILKAL